MQDVLGSIEVGVENHVADFALEGRTLSLPSPQATTGRTGLGCIFGRNKLDSNTSFFPLILEKNLQLEKRPVGETPVLFLPVSGRAYSFEIFQDDYSVFSCAFYQSSAEDVIGVDSKTFLLLPDFAQMQTGRASAYCLQHTSHITIPVFDVEKMVAVVQPSVRSSDYVIDSSINPNHSACLGRNARRTLNRNHQSELSISAYNKVAFLDLPIGELLEIQRNIQFHFDSPALGQQTGRLLCQVNCAASGIIVNRLSREARSWGFSLDSRFDCDASKLVGDNSKLRGQTKTTAKNRICDVVHPERVGLLVLIARGNDEVLGLGHKSKVFIKDSSLGWKLLNHSLYRFHHDYTVEGKVYKGCHQYNRHGEHNKLGEIQYQLSYRLVPKISTRSSNRRPSEVSGIDNQQHINRTRMGNSGIESDARPHSSFHIGSSKIRSNRHRSISERQKLARDVSTIPASETGSLGRKTMVSKLLCRNGRARFRRDNTTIHTRTGERESQFLLRLKPEVSLRVSL